MVDRKCRIALITGVMSATGLVAENAATPASAQSAVQASSLGSYQGSDPPCPWKLGCESSEDRKVVKRKILLNNEGDFTYGWWDFTRSNRDNFCANLKMQDNMEQYYGSYCDYDSPPM
ncbi:hypothetical protein [Actinomadura roseirufa]|uniref:hypothetical protein n=1 Tax=Actinomadura roseirufa TaxID=2094049 RepID=UPI0010415342|nr:hypothetical protein [Actinomadura roseirufa]